MKLFFALVLKAGILAAALMEPYASLELLDEYPFGYYVNQKYIEALFKEHDIKVALEVGSWIGGGSTRHMGDLLKKRQGKLYAVDTWLGSTTQQEGKIHYQPILPSVYQQFLSNMVHWGLEETVIPCRMRSVEAARALNVAPDLIYIDGEHTEEAVYEDLTVWYPFVQGKGILCGDDWTWKSVRAAVERFAKERGLVVFGEGNFWILIETHK